MGYALPSGVINTGSLHVYLQDAVSTYGPYVKHVSDQTLVLVDYNELTELVVEGSGFNFSIDVSSNPQLVISYPLPDQVSSGVWVLSFLLSGGIPGQQYTISISCTVGSTPRVDNLVINIPSSTGTDIINPVPAIYNQIPLWGGGYINSAVRAFWGSVPPSNPNVLDQWFSTADGNLYEWATDGTTPEWVIIYSDKYLIDAPYDGVLYGRLDDT